MRLPYVATLKHRAEVSQFGLFVCLFSNNYYYYYCFIDLVKQTSSLSPSLSVPLSLSPSLSTSIPDLILNLAFA